MIFDKKAVAISKNSDHTTPDLFLEKNNSGKQKEKEKAQSINTRNNGFFGKKLILSAGLIGIFLVFMVSQNMKYLKEVFLKTSTARFIASLKDQQVFDPDHVITTLNNGMPIIVNKYDQCVCLIVRLTGRWDSNETAVINHLVKPGFQIVEVGANFGVHTLRMASLIGKTGKIHAFEANPLVSKYLKQSVNLNSLQDIITVYEKAAGENKGEAYLTFGLQNIGNGHLIVNNDGKSAKVEIVKIDDLLPDFKADLLKIDAEGYEEKIIKGAKKLIEANPHIILMMEWSQELLTNQNTDPKNLLEMLKSFGFKIWKIGPHRNLKANLIPVSFEEIMDLPYADLVAARQELI